MTPEEHELLVTLVARQEQIATRLEQIVGMIIAVDTRLDRLAEAFVRHSHGEAA